MASVGTPIYQSSATISSGTINSEPINSGAINSEPINSGTINSEPISSGTISSAKDSRMNYSMQSNFSGPHFCEYLSVLTYLFRTRTCDDSTMEEGTIKTSRREKQQNDHQALKQINRMSLLSGTFITESTEHRIRLR